MIVPERVLFKAIKEDNIEAFEDYVTIFYPADYKFSRFFSCAYAYLRNSPPMIAVAAYLKSIKVLKYLLAIGADTTATDDSQTSLASFAVAGGDMSILCLFNELNVSFDGTLFVAAESGNFQVFMWIFATQIVDINQRRQDSSTVLHAAARSGNWKLIRFLLDEIQDYLDIKDIFEIGAELRDHIESDSSEEEEQTESSWT